MAVDSVTIGTRGSALALWQSNAIKARLEQTHRGLDVQLRIIKTLGDKILDAPLSKIGDKGLFTKELEQALLDERIDLAVHSLKDIPTQVPAGLTLGAICEREDVRDVFIAHPDKRRQFNDLPPNARIATGSLRRRCQLLHHRSDLVVVDIRGNLNTRIAKLEVSDWDGMILAHAGVLRLGWQDRIADILPTEVMLPAVGQGALGIEIRSNDTRLQSLVAPLHHATTASATLGERALLRRLEGGCQVPIGTYGRVDQEMFLLDAMIGSLDGKKFVRGSIRGSVGEAESLGVRLAEDLLGKGGKEILDEIRNMNSPNPLPTDV